MAITFNTLSQQILGYLNRSDTTTTNQVPFLINLAEQRISRECENLGFVKHVVSNFTVGQSVYQKPARWRRNLSFSYGSGTGFNTYTPLLLASEEFLRNYCPNPTVTSPPKFYADYDYENFLISPTPDQTYPFQYIYLELLQPLTISNQTNWLTNYAYDLLLSACLVEAYYFVENDSRAQTWDQKYKELAADVNSQNQKRLFDRQSKVSIQ